MGTRGGHKGFFFIPFYSILKFSIYIFFFKIKKKDCFQKIMFYYWMQNDQNVHSMQKVIIISLFLLLY